MYSEEKIKKAKQLLEDYTKDDLGIMVRHDIEEHFVNKLAEHPDATPVEAADFVVDYIFEKFCGNVVQAAISQQITHTQTVLLMRQDIIRELKS